MLGVSDKDRVAAAEIWSAVASTGVPSAAAALGWSKRDTPLDICQSMIQSAVEARQSRDSAGALQIQRAPSGRRIIWDAIQGWRDLPSLTPGYLLSRLRREYP